MQIPEQPPVPADLGKAQLQPIRPVLDTDVCIAQPVASSFHLQKVDGCASALRQLFDFQTVIRSSQPEKMKAYRVMSNALSLEMRTNTSRLVTEAVAIALDR